MCLATGVEPGRAFRASVCSQIGLNRQLGLACSAKNGEPIPLFTRPLLSGVPCAFGMAETARIVPVTAVEAYGNDVESGRIVLAPSVVIDVLSDTCGDDVIVHAFAVPGANQDTHWSQENHLKKVTIGSAT